MWQFCCCIAPHFCGLDARETGRKRKYVHFEGSESKQSCTVAKLTGTGAVKRRIMDMGLTKGMVHVKKVAPTGDPIELTVPCK